MSEVVALRICWPPDSVCLQGGCGYCHLEEFRSLEEIADRAKTSGLWWDFVYSQERGFPNFRTKIKED